MWLGYRGLVAVAWILWLHSNVFGVSVRYGEDPTLTCVRCVGYVRRRPYANVCSVCRLGTVKTLL